MATPTPPSDPHTGPAVDPVFPHLPGDSVSDLVADPVVAPDLSVPGLETPPVAAVPMPPPVAPDGEPSGVFAAPRADRAVPAINTVGPISGIFFVALFVVSFLLQNTPDGNASNRTWTSYWEDGGNRTQGITAAIAMMLAAICFLWLVAALRRRLVGAVGADAAYASGIAAGALMFVAGLGAGLIPLGYQLADVPIPDDPDVIRMVDGIYYGTIFLPLPYALAGFLIPLFFALRGSYLLPRWLEYATAVVAALMLAGPLLFVVPHALFMLWTVAVGVTLLLRERDLPAVVPPL